MGRYKKVNRVLSKLLNLSNKNSSKKSVKGKQSKRVWVNSCPINCPVQMSY